MKIILWFFDSIQFVGAIVEYYPFTLWIHPICSGYWLALQTPTEWSGLEGNKLALPMQNSRYQGGVHLQDGRGRTQGQNFAQNGSQKPFCNGPEASDLVTKISTGIIYIYICICIIHVFISQIRPTEDIKQEDIRWYIDITHM